MMLTQEQQHDNLLRVLKGRDPFRPIWKMVYPLIMNSSVYDQTTYEEAMYGMGHHTGGWTFDALYAEWSRMINDCPDFYRQCVLQDYYK